MDKYDKMILESIQRYKWWVSGNGIHCIPYDLFVKIPTIRLCELYNVELNYFGL